jgi:hypothetical protein
MNFIDQMLILISVINILVLAAVSVAYKRHRKLKCLSNYVFAHPADGGDVWNAGDFECELARSDAGYVVTGSGRSSRVRRMA